MLLEQECFCLAGNAGWAQGDLPNRRCSRTVQQADRAPSQVPRELGGMCGIVIQYPGRTFTRSVTQEHIRGIDREGWGEAERGEGKQRGVGEAEGGGGGRERGRQGKRVGGREVG